jgi:hypothetical protein
MRKLFSLMLLATVGCTTKNTRTDLLREINKEPSAIHGTWRRVEELRDPGDGSGTWTPVAPAAQSIVTFDPGGKLSVTAHSVLSQYNRYQVITPRELHLYSPSGDSAKVYFMVDGKLLQLNFEAREAMQDRFVREQQ